MQQDNKLFVGNLNFRVSGDDLAGLFSQFGEVTDAVVISDRATGRSKGFGFVTFASADQAKTAMEQLNETEFMERKLTISIARPPEKRENRGFGGGNRGGYNSGNRGGYRN